MNDNTVYIISNVPRSGSSMMMRCLEGGGMDVAYDQSQEYLNVKFNSNYVPNPNGFYALAADFDNPDFAAIYSGKTLKFPIQKLLNLPVANYKLLFMKRAPEDIEASMAAFMPFMPIGRPRAMVEFYDLYVDALLDELTERSDISITILNYSDVVNDPETAFATLVTNGWPITDVSSAISLVDGSLQHFDLEQE